MTTFADLGLNPELLKAIDDVGYTIPTPIQEQAIPTILMMRDMMGCAQTGTGKTASFTLPMIEILSQGQAKARMPRSLILEPTRELATQVAENFELYGKYHKLSMALLIGGETMGAQIKKLDRGIDVLIATPGRLLDLIERGNILMNDIKIFVIDEADRMMDMGFIPDVEKISSRIPTLRQTLFFSATMAPEIEKLSRKFLSNPKIISVAPPATTGGNIKQVLISMPSKNDWQKREALRILLRKENVQNAFIFCNRKRDVALLQKSLSSHGFNVGALHGDLTQSSRTETLNAFKTGEITFLACSDVAARGLDVPDVSHVFNFDVPFNAEDYVHRIGRTGRAGKEGTAYTLSTPEDSKQIIAIEALIQQALPREIMDELPSVDPKKSGKPPRKPRSAAPKKNRAAAPRPEARGSDPKKQATHPLPAQHHSDHPEDAEVFSPQPKKAPLSQNRNETKRKPSERQIMRELEKPIGFGEDLPAFLRRPPARPDALGSDKSE